MRPKSIAILKLTVWLCLLLPLTTQPVSGQVRKPTLVSPSKLGKALQLTPAQIRTALGLSASDVISISTGTSALDGFDVFNTRATSFPTEGDSYLVMSSGATSSALTPNADGNRSTELGGLNTTAGDDLVQIVLQLQPPPGATCLSFDFAFYSEEFPEFVGSQFNDAFIAEIGQSTFQIVNNQVIAPNNFAFDTATNVISVNTLFGVTAAAATGTTYDGGTPLLTAVTPLEIPGQPVTITLSIMDLGDSIYDSTVFIDNFRWSFGTDCRPGAVADSDGDGLLDDWEINGIDFDHDGIIDLDLPAMGADPHHKDIFVEIDYMVLGGVGGHSHRPKLDALQTVIDAFANAPVANPDGTTGIRIHIDAGANTIMNPVTGALWGTRSQSDELTHVNNLGTMSGPNYNWSAFDVIKGVGVPGKFSIQRGDVFHYCIFGHSLATALTTTSGIARDIPSSDFLVTLGGWTGDVGSVNEQAGTLMHELGHNLGLLHGGDEPFMNFKPNYLSIMNYAFQMRGLRIGGSDGHFDYSRFLLPVLNEAALNENVGISGVAEAAGYGTRFFDSSGAARIANNINGPIDWNNSGVSTDNPISVDINRSGTLSVLGNADNWDQIVFDGGAVGHLGEAIVLPSETVPDDINEPQDMAIPTEFKIKASGPGAVLTPNCVVQHYTYQIHNMGNSDDIYVLTVSDSQGWADTSALPAALPLASGASAMFIVPVTIPAIAPAGAVDKLSITATSAGNPLMFDVAETRTTVDTNPPPAIVCPANFTVEFTSANGAVVLFTPTAADNCPVTTVCVPASGDTFPIGTTVVACTATDSGGLTAACSFSVTVLGPRGVKQSALDELIALRAATTNQHDRDELDKAIEHLTKSLSTEWWIDQTHLVRKGGEKAINEEKRAVHELEDLLKDKKSTISQAVLQGFIDRIVKSDRLLALIAINEAAAAGLSQKKIDEDLKELAKGDEDAAKGRAEEAIGHYRHAWQHAVHLKIKPPQMLAGGGQHLEFLAVPGESYIIQASSNLVDWTTLGAVTADDNGAIAFDDAGAALFSSRFYRVVQP